MGYIIAISAGSVIVAGAIWDFMGLAKIAVAITVLAAAVVVVSFIKGAIRQRT